jgi:hypothetical protein
MRSDRDYFRSMLSDCETTSQIDRVCFELEQQIREACAHDPPSAEGELSLLWEAARERERELQISR